MSRRHTYRVGIEWTGNRGKGTTAYGAYDRNHKIVVEGKADVRGSSDPAFRGDSTRHNPEELLVASLSACHMLMYLHACADAGVVVTAYADMATGTMDETPDGGGRFTSVTLHPLVTVSEDSMIAQAVTLHKRAHELCFIANSVSFPVSCIPVVRTEDGDLEGLQGIPEKDTGDEE